MKVTLNDIQENLDEFHSAEMLDAEEFEDQIENISKEVKGERGSAEFVTSLKNALWKRI